MPTYIYMPLAAGTSMINTFARYTVGGSNLLGYSVASANVQGDPAFTDAVFTTGAAWPSSEVFDTGAGGDEWWAIHNGIGVQMDLSATDPYTIYTATFAGSAQGVITACTLSVSFNFTEPSLANFTGFKVDTQYDNHTFAIPANGTFTVSQPGWVGQTLNGNVAFELIYTFIPSVPAGLADIEGTFSDIRLTFEVSSASNPQIRAYDGHTDRVFARIPSAT